MASPPFVFYALVENLRREQLRLTRLRSFELFYSREHNIAKFLVLKRFDDGRLNPTLFYSAVEALALVYSRVDRLFFEQR